MCSLLAYKTATETPSSCVLSCQQVYSQRFICTHKSLITMVAVNASGRPVKNVPLLVYSTPDEHAMRLLAEQRDKLSKEWAAREAVRSGLLLLLRRGTSCST